MFACTDTPSPVACPAASMQSAPVCTATRPVASRNATWRRAWSVSADVSACSAVDGSTPRRISASPRGPYAGSANDCVATTPMPGSAHVTTEPTEK